MITVDTISAIKTDTLRALISKESEVFADASVEQVESDFVNYINGPGAYDDYTNWRQAWRGFVEFSANDEGEEADETETVIGYLLAHFPTALLSAENQMALF